MKVFYILIIAVLFFANISFGETIYFLAANPSETTSFVVPLTDPNHIAHARDLIVNGPGIGNSFVDAEIICGFDGVNRNLIAPSKPLWNWHITNVNGFCSFSIPEQPAFLDLVIDCEQYIADNGSSIGAFRDTSFTIVEELDPIDAGHWQCDFVYDDEVNMNDMAILGMYWLHDDCTGPDWCAGADLNYNGIVDIAELRICAGAWLSDNPYDYEPYWFDAWNCPTQCHGNADCESEVVPLKYPVYIKDLQLLTSLFVCRSWPMILCGDMCYNPQVDFDRDCDVDEDDGAILEHWFGVRESQFPTDCPTNP